MASGLAGGKDVSIHSDRPINYIENQRFVKPFLRFFSSLSGFRPGSPILL